MVEERTCTLLSLHSEEKERIVNNCKILQPLVFFSSLPGDFLEGPPSSKERYSTLLKFSLLLWLPSIFETQTTSCLNFTLSRLVGSQMQHQSSQSLVETYSILEQKFSPLLTCSCDPCVLSRLIFNVQTALSSYGKQLFFSLPTILLIFLLKYSNMYSPFDGISTANNKVAGYHPD